jgi:hypothetical protein
VPGAGGSGAITRFSGQRVTWILIPGGDDDAVRVPISTGWDKSSRLSSR